jgi:hypothetical protein
VICHPVRLPAFRYQGCFAVCVGRHISEFTEMMIYGVPFLWLRQCACWHSYQRTKSMYIFHVGRITYLRTVPNNLASRTCRCTCITTGGLCFMVRTRDRVQYQVRVSRATRVESLHKLGTHPVPAAQQCEHLHPVLTQGGTDVTLCDNVRVVLNNWQDVLIQL